MEGEAVERGEEKGPGCGGRQPGVCVGGRWETRPWASSPQESRGVERGLPRSRSSFCSQECSRPLDRAGFRAASLTGLLLLQVISWASGERVTETGGSPPASPAWWSLVAFWHTRTPGGVE